jgi:hypothetical protein
MAARLALAPVTITRKFPAFRSGRMEAWEAVTSDGAWTCAREESPGTPWLLYSNASVADGSYTLPVLICGTLRACRALVASGGADQELARRIAEKDEG